VEVAPTVAVDEQHPIVEFPPGTPIFSLNVECFTASKHHNSRSVAHIVLADEWCRPVCSIYVKQEGPVTSPTTGLTQELVEAHGIPRADALVTLRSYIPPHAVLVGQNVGTDVRWLNLVEGLDFDSMVDLAALFRVWNPQLSSWCVYSQDHVAKSLLGIGDRPMHDAVTNAAISISLFNLYRHYQWDEDAIQHFKEQIINTPMTPSFDVTAATMEGCSLCNKPTCACHLSSNHAK
jgi:hypothetical protein